MKRYILILSIMWIFTKFNFLYGMESDKNLLRSYPYDLSSIKNFYLKQNTISHMLILYSENKSSNLGSNLLTYALEFTASSIMPAFLTASYFYWGGVNPPPWTWYDMFSFYITYTGLNCITVPLTTHLIGKLAKKGGNLYTSLIGTFLGCIPSWIIINYENKGYFLNAPEFLYELSLLSMAFGPPVGGVIGYNLKF